MVEEGTSSTMYPGTGIYKFGNNNYPQRIGRRSNSGHIFKGEKVRLMGREIRYFLAHHDVFHQNE